MSLWQTQPFASRLYQLMGPTLYQTLLVNVQEPEPIGAEDGTIYVLGNRMLSAGTESAAVVVDTKRDVIYVWLKHEGETKEFIENGRTITLPAAVRKAILEHKSHPSFLSSPPKPPLRRRATAPSSSAPLLTKSIGT